MQQQKEQAISEDGRPIKIHSAEDFESMRKAGQLAAKCLDFITPHVRPNISTNHLNKLCHDFNEKHGATNAPLNYRGFPGFWRG